MVNDAFVLVLNGRRPRIQLKKVYYACIPYEFGKFVLSFRVFFLQRKLSARRSIWLIVRAWFDGFLVIFREIHLLNLFSVGHQLVLWVLHGFVFVRIWTLERALGNLILQNITALTGQVILHQGGSLVMIYFPFIARARFRFILGGVGAAVIGDNNFTDFLGQLLIWIIVVSYEAIANISSRAIVVV